MRFSQSSPSNFKAVTLWVIVLLGCLLLGGTGYLYVQWMRTDEILAEKLRQEFDKRLPGWGIKFEQARFDIQGQIHLYDLKVSLPEDDLPIAECPEVLLILDREQFKQGQIQLQQVRFQQPQFNIAQNDDGSWNYQQLPLPKTLDGAAHEWIMQQGTVFVAIRSTDDHADAKLVFRKTNINVVPSGKRQYLLKGDTTVDRAGLMNLKGRVDLDAKSWSLGGEVNGLRLGPDLLGLVSTISPTFRTNLQQNLQRLPGNSSNVSDLVLDAQGDLSFSLSQPANSPDQEYEARLKLRGGKFSHPAIAYQLTDMQGEIIANNHEFRVRGLTAQNGPTSCRISGVVRRQDQEKPGEFVIIADEVVLDERIQTLLNERGRAALEQIHPSGRAKVSLMLHLTSSGVKLEKAEVIPLQCTIRHQKFPYPVDGVTGAVNLKDGVWRFEETKGWAGKREVLLGGYFDPDGQTLIEIKTKRVAIDDTFIETAPEILQKILKTLRLRGGADAIYRLTRSRGTAPYEHELEAKLINCGMSYEYFPYDLRNLNGKVRWKGGAWSFEELTAEHDSSTVSGQGTYTYSTNENGLLKLSIRSNNSDFDPSLRKALPKMLDEVWETVDPEGQFNSRSLIEWRPGGSPTVTIEDLELTNASFMLRAFPYKVEQAQGHLSWQGEKLTIGRIKGVNRETRLEFHGEGTFPQTGDRPWNVHLDELLVSDLDPDRRFRKVLPNPLRQMVDDLDPRKGLVSLEGAFDFKGVGSAGEELTAAWNVDVIFSGGTATVGIDVNNIYGKVRCEGEWNEHQEMHAVGDLEIESLMLNGYQFTQVRGPWEVHNEELIVGSKKAIERVTSDGLKPNLPPHERVQAKAIDGSFFLDGQIDLKRPFPYHILVKMQDTKLEKFAAEYLAGQRNLRGIMNGWLELWGDSSAPQNGRTKTNTASLKGNGELHIAPAALYELPAVMQILRLISFVPADNPAFAEAHMMFDIAKNQINFRQISLLGDAINLYGLGFVNFDQRLGMEFIARVPQNGGPLPFVKGLVGLVANDGWGVSLTGTLTEPVAVLRAVPKLDPRLNELFRTIEFNRKTNVPGSPGTGPRQSSSDPPQVNQAPKNTSTQ